MQLVSLEEYLSKYNALYELYAKAFSFLPMLKEKKMFVKIHEQFLQQEELDVSRDLEKENVWYVGFSNDPPTPVELLQVLIHVESGDKMLARHFSYLLLYAINKNLPSFNLLDLLDIDLETINKVLEKLYKLKSVEDYFTLLGLVRLEIAYLDHFTMTVKLKEDVPENVVVRVFLEKIADSISIWYDPVENECISIGCTIFEKLASILSKHKQ
ncbi:MAG: hypothetical protein QXD20_09905 [Ignisphaera sp.]